MKCIKTKLKLNNKQNIDRDLSESINLRNTVCLRVNIRVNIYGSPAADSSGGSRKSTLKYHYKECYNTKYNGC